MVGEAVARIKDVAGKGAGQSGDDHVLLAGELGNVLDEGFAESLTLPVGMCDDGVHEYQLVVLVKKLVLAFRNGLLKGIHMVGDLFTWGVHHVENFLEMSATD